MNLLNIMLTKLDKKDRQILSELDSNARQPLSKIAKKVRLSKEAVYYRIKTLEKKKIIINYTVFVSLAKLNLMQAKFLIKLQNTTKQIKQEIINYFIVHKNTNWVGTCKGTYDLIIGFVVKDIKNLNNIKEEFLNKYSNYILKSNFSIMIEAELYGRKYFLNNKPKAVSYIGTPEKKSLDETDIKILNLLTKNSKQKITEISSKLKTTARIVSYKIKQLEKKGVIQKYTTAINHSKLGISFFKLFIHLANTKNKNQIIEFLANNKSCFGNVDVFAEWSLEPEFEVYSTEELYKIIDELEQRFGSDIKTINTIMIDKEYKFKPLPI